MKDSEENNGKNGKQSFPLAQLARPRGVLPEMIQNFLYCMPKTLGWIVMFAVSFRSGEDVFICLKWQMVCSW